MKLEIGQVLIYTSKANFNPDVVVSRIKDGYILKDLATGNERDVTNDFISHMKLYWGMNVG